MILTRSDLRRLAIVNAAITLGAYAVGIALGYRAGKRGWR